MSFEACIKAAVESGRIRDEKAREALDAFRAERDRLRAIGEPDGAIDDAAALAATEALTTAKRDARWRRVNEMRAAERIHRMFDAGKLKPHEVPAAIMEHHDKSPFGNIVTRTDRRMGQLHAKMESALYRFRPRASGILHPVRNMHNVVRETFGEATGDQSAKEIADAWRETIEFARQMANRAGAAIPKNPHFNMPQMHDRLRMRGRKDKWIDDHMAWLDWEQMKHFNDGQPIDPANRRDVLEHVYDTLLTDGYVRIQPGVPAESGVASRLSRQRFLHYKDADSWAAAAKTYGNGDALNQMISYMHSMARDIAMLEVMGPNEHGMKKFIERMVQKRAGDAEAAGRKGAVSKADDAVERFDEMWQVHTRGSAMGEENGIGHAMAGLRNLLSSSMLGAATLAAIPGDLGLSKFAAATNGMPVLGHVRRYLSMLNPADASDRRLAVRSGLIAESATSIAMGHSRFFGDITGPQWSRRMADVTMRASLMTPHTQALKWAVGMEMMGAFADYAGKRFDDLPFRDMLERHGIGAGEWDLFRSTPVHEHENSRFLRPDDLFASEAGDPARNREVADLFMDMVLSERRFSVVESSLRGRTMLVSDTQGGSLPGEVLRSLAMFKNFPVTIMLTHLSRGFARSTVTDRVAYTAAFFGTLTVAGALAVQANEVASGRDPMDMTSAAFWGKAALKGGGLGYLGDFLFADLNRYGAGMSEMVSGPVVSFMDDMRNLTVGNMLQLIEGEDTRFRQELLTVASRYTPASTLWYAKLVLRRKVLDWLAEETDPKAHRRFRQQVRNARRDFNQEYWWRPGESSPDRAPAFGQ